jgi:hypothetical protein
MLSFSLCFLKHVLLPRIIHYLICFVADNGTISAAELAQCHRKVEGVNQNSD